MVGFFDKVQSVDDIRAFRPVPATESELRRGDLVSMTFTLSIIATPQAFGMFPDVTTLMRLHKAMTASDRDHTAEFASDMGFFSYPTAEETADVVPPGGTLFNGIVVMEEGAPPPYSAPKHPRDTDENENLGHKKHRGDDVPMTDA